MFKVIALGWWVSYFAAHWLCIYRFGVTTWTTIWFLIGAVFFTFTAMGHEMNKLRAATEALKAAQVKSIQANVEKVKQALQDHQGGGGSRK